VAVDRRPAEDLAAVTAPQVPILPVVADLLRHLALEVTSAVGPLAEIDVVFADAQLDRHRHRAGPLADGAGDAVVRPHVERDRFQIFPQRAGFPDDPRLAFGLLKDLGKHAGAMQRDANRGGDDGPSQGRHVGMGCVGLRRQQPRRRPTAHGGQSGRRARALQEPPP